MADDDWQDWQPPPAAAAPQAAGAEDDWQDWQPPPAAQAAGTDDWQDWQDTRDSKPPTPEDWKNIKPDQINKTPESRGIQERATAGFKEGYHPLFSDAVSKIAPDFAKEHPIIAGVLQGALNQSPLGWADKAQAALFGGAPGGVAGAVAGAAEPLIGRSQADKLQSDTKTLIDMGLIAPGLGWAGAAAHGRGAQLTDVGKQGLRELKTQGQTPGSAGPPGVAQEPNPPAKQPVADAQNKTTLGDGAMETGGENLNTRDYGKTPAATGEASGVNVLKDGVDPTLSSTLKTETTVAEQPVKAAREQPPMGTQVPTAEQAAAAQARIAERRQPPSIDTGITGSQRPSAAPVEGLLPQKQPFYDAAKAEAPNLPHDQLLHIANVAGGPKAAALQARLAARRMAEEAGVTPGERAPVPAGTMELPPVEVKPPGAEVPPKAAEAIATSKAAEAKPLKPGSPEAQAAVEAFNAKPEPVQPLRPGSPEAQAAIESFNAKPEPVEAAPVKRTKAERQKFDYAVKEAMGLRLRNGIQPTDPLIIAEIAKRDAARDARAAARTEKIQAEVEAGQPAPPDVRPVTEPAPAAPIPGSKAAQRAEAAAAVAQFEAKKKSSGVAYNLATPEGRAAQAAAEAAAKEAPAKVSRPSTDYTGKLRDDISHTEYVDRMQELRDNKPRPINKLWNNPKLAPPERVKAQQEAIKAWNSEYNAVNKNQKLALERDNIAFREKQRASPVEPSAEALAERADPGVAPQSAGAAAAPPPTPAPPPPRIHTRALDTLRTAYNNFLDTGKAVIGEIQGHLTPMAKGTNETRAMVKDHADAMRRIDYEWTVADDHIQKHFNREQQKRMWDAADEENVMRQRGEQSEHMGIATLEPAERALVESFQPKARELWEHAREIGMVEGEGLPYYTPRMLNNIMQRAEGGSPRSLDGMRGDLTSSSPNLRRRKYMEAEETEAAAKRAFGDEAELVRNIRTMPLVLAKMEKAIAGRQLINQIREAGRRAGENTVLEGKPNEPGWFTIAENPSFYTYRPRYEHADTPVYRSAAEARSGVAVPDAMIPLMDRNGNPVVDRVPLYIHPDFEGPLRSIMHRPSGLLYSGFMGLKGRTMQLIMNSPAIHNMVEWGRALPTMPGKMVTLQVYFEGNAARRGVPYNGTARHIMDWATGKLETAPRDASPTMVEAINAGMVPIGKRFTFQDLSGMMETPNLDPGRGLLAKGVGTLGDLITPKLGDMARRGIDRMGDIWHNTMLWERVADLQAGIYTNSRDAMIAKGIDPLSAQRVAAHIANRYAGALPQEAMSGAARKWANIGMFSRTFTMGNLGVMKDMLTGLPRDVQAQIIRDAGQLDPKAAGYIKDMARRKAMMVVAVDVAAMYLGNSLLQSAFNMLQDDNTLSKEMQGYVRRMNEALKAMKEDPLSLFSPLTIAGGAVGAAAKGVPGAIVGGLAGTAMSQLEKLSATHENEPEKHDRIMVGKTKEGRAIYMRNPVGKIGEEFMGYMTKPFKMTQAKMSTMLRPLFQIYTNDKGFGQKMYNPNTHTTKQILEAGIAIGGHFAAAQTPEGQLRALRDLISGENAQKVGGIPVNALQAFGPIGGFTFSQGHPGGPAAGELSRFTEERKFEMSPQLTEIRKMVREGQLDKAIDRMNELELDKGTRQYLMNPRMSPRQMKELYRRGTDEQLDRFERRR